MDPPITLQDFAQQRGVSVNTFRAQLRRHVAGISGPGVPPPAKRVRIQLSDRDAAIMTRLAHDRCNTLESIAARSFGKTGCPLKTAYGRLHLLEQAGLIRITRNRGQALVALTPKGARRIGAAAPRGVHPRHLRHHLATLEAIDMYKQHIEGAGGHFAPSLTPEGYKEAYRLEFHVQSAERRGQGTSSGTRYEASPDAVAYVQVPCAASGQMVDQEVAIEFFTSAYSDAQIEGKMEFAQNYAAVYQVADTQRTADRVERITGLPCYVLRSPA